MIKIYILLYFIILFRNKIEEKLRMVEEGGSKNDLEKTINDLEQSIQDLEEKNNELAGSVRIWLKHFISSTKNFLIPNCFCINTFKSRMYVTPPYVRYIQIGKILKSLKEWIYLWSTYSGFLCSHFDNKATFYEC